MTDSKQKVGKQDRERVSSSEGYEVEDLHRKYPHLAHQVVADAVKTHGPKRTDIETILDSLKKK
jgi:Protein of unknown function (DUF3606)